MFKKRKPVKINIWESRKKRLKYELKNKHHTAVNQFFRIIYEPVWYIPLMFCSYVYSLSIITYIPHIMMRKTSVLDIYWNMIDCWYAVDILLTLVCKYRKSIAAPYINKSDRPLWVIFLEILSVIPFSRTIEYFREVPIVAAVLLRFLHTFKLVRLFYYFYFIHCLIYLEFLFRIIIMTVCLLLMITFGYGITSFEFCMNFDCEQIDRTHLFIKYASIITTVGFPALQKRNAPYVEMLNVIISMLSLFVVMSSLMASGVYEYILSATHKFSFRNRIRLLKYQMEALGIHEYIRNLILTFYNKLWQNELGYVSSSNMYNIIPPGMRHEILLDTYYVALKHSLIFRNCDVFMIRYAASLMSRKFFNPGENLYERGEIKTKMIYVISGVIEIISEQDGETPVLSLSSGACLGEISLFKIQKATATVRCKNFVELQELSRKDFIHCARLYPEKYRKLLKMCNERYEAALNFHPLVEHFNQKNEETDCFTIIWLKNIMNNITAANKEQEIENIYVQRENSIDRLKTMIFTTNYLDLLALADKVELNETAEFVKATFPFIFHPNSVSLKIWEGFILITCLFMLYTLPKYCFIKIEDVHRYLILTYELIGFVWYMDLYMQCSTAVIKSDAIHTTIAEITDYRLNSIGFLADIFAVIPLEVFTVLIVKETSGFNRFVLKSNRFVKAWRILNLFKVWENKLNVNIRKLVYFRFTFAFMYVIYLTHCLLDASVCNYPPYDCTYMEKYSTIHSAVQIVSGVGLLGPYDELYHYSVIYCCIIVFSIISFTLMTIYFISAMMLTSINQIALEKKVIELKSVFKKYAIGTLFTNRIYKYIETQWRYNSGRSLMQISWMYGEIPTSLLMQLKESGFIDMLRDITFFKNLPEDLLADINIALTYDILPPNEVICYAGDYANNLIIVRDGVCDVIGQEHVLKSDKEVLNPLAFIYQLPIMRTCITKTHCFLVILSYDKFVMILEKYHASTVFFCKTPEFKTYFTERMTDHLQFDTTLHKVKQEKQKSFNNFGYQLKTKQQYNEYAVPFEQLSHFKCVRFLLMRHTINPYGKFFFWYEIVRSLLAFVSATSHSMLFVIASDDLVWKVILYFLDAIAYLDIYIRLHVCYYNENGLVVKHPLSTAKHYLTHNFPIDLLACLPFEFLSHEKIIRSSFTLFLYFNRILQFYRYLGVTHYCGSIRVEPKSKWYYFRFVPVIFLMSTLMGSLILINTCVIHSSLIHTGSNMSELLENGISCEANTFLLRTRFTKPISPIRAQLYATYVISSCISTIGIQGFTLDNQHIGSYTSIFTVIGIYFGIYLLNKTVLYSLSTSDVLSMYQASLRNLKSFMRLNKIPNYLQHLIVSHFDLRWERQRGKNINHLMQDFHYTLKQDILYSIYGQSIYEMSIFPNEGKKLVRNLIMYTAHETYMKDAKIVRVNDINSQLHIIYRGMVNVIASDGTILESLGVGAIFGNIDGHSYVRQTMNFTADSVVELLSLSSVQFFKVISEFPALKTIFVMTTRRFVHYLPSQESKRRKTAMHFDSFEILEGLGAKMLYALNTSVFDPDSQYVRGWQIINLIGCYISLISYMYQMALSEFNTYYLIIEYLCDLISIINFYMTDHLAFENESGAKVTDLKEIKKHNRRNRLQFFLNVFGLLPLDLAPLVLPFNYEIKYKLIKMLRVNRLQRIQSVNDYFEMNLQKITIKTNLLQISFMFIYLSLITTFISCLIISISTYYKDNMSRNVPTDMLNVEVSKKLEILMTYLFNTLCCISRIAQDQDYPQTSVLIALYIILMAIYPIIWSILIAQICVITFKNQFLKTTFRQKIDKLYYYITKQEISEAIVSKIIRYLNVIWLSNDGVKFPYLLQTAPYYIYEAIMCEINLKHVNSHKIFKKCHVDFKRQLACRLRTDIYFPGDYITFKNTINHTMYVVDQGDVEVLDEDENTNKTSVGILPQNSWFGVLEGIHSLATHKYTYRAFSVCHVSSLKFDDWQHLLNFFPATKNVIYQRTETLKNEISESE